ncbi:MAG: LCP family protein [Actinomycetota bacterium]
MTAVVVVGALGAACVFQWDWVRARADDVAGQVSRWSTSLRNTAATLPEAEVDARTLIGESAAALIVIGSDENDAAFALLSVAPTGPPAVVILPQPMLLSVPGYGEFRLVDALQFEGPDLAALAVTNEFGVRIDRVVAVPAGTLATAVDQPVTVDLATPMFVDQGGTIQRVVDAGESEVSPQVLETLLVTQGEGDPFEWLQRQGAVWRAVLDAVVARPAVADRLLIESGGTAAADLLVTVAGNDDAVVATVPVERAQSASPDTLAPVTDRIDGFVAERLGHLLIRPAGRPRIEILNGNGRIGATRGVAELLVRLGFELVRTDNAASFDYPETIVIGQGQNNEAAAREVAAALGRGSLQLEVREPSAVIDVSIIVGDDIPAEEG